MYIAKTIASSDQNKDICWTMLCLATLFSPLRCYGLFTIGVFTGSLFKIFSFLMILFTFFKLVSKKYRYYQKDYLQIAFLIVCFDLFTVIYSNKSDLGLFSTYFVEHLILFFGLIVISNHKGDITSLIKSFILSAIIPAILGIYQWITFMRTGNVAELPFKSFLITAGKDDIVLYGAYRVVGTLQDPSYYGLYMAAIVILCLGIVILYGYDSVLKRYRKTAIIMLLLSITSLLMSGSVSSMTNVICGFLFYLFIIRKKGKKVFVPILIGIISVAVVLWLLSFYFDFEPLLIVMDKLDRQSGGGDSFGRSEFFKQAFDDFLSSPIWGVGYGNLKLSSAHNSFLTILAQHGFIGLLLHSLLLIFIPFRMRKVMNIKNNSNAVSAIITYGTCFGMICQVMAYDCLYKMDPTIVILLLMYASIEFRNSNNLKIASRSIK